MKKIKKLLSLGLLATCAMTTLAVPALAKSSSADAKLTKNFTTSVKSKMYNSVGPTAHRYIAVDAANVRSGPGTQYDIVCTLDHNTDVIIDSLQEDGWDHVVGGDVGVSPGWIRDDLLGYEQEY